MLDESKQRKGSNRKDGTYTVAGEVIKAVVLLLVIALAWYLNQG